LRRIRHTGVCKQPDTGCNTGPCVITIKVRSTEVCPQRLYPERMSDYRKQLGHYLKSHIDDRKLSKEAIINVSLAGDCYMTFTKICAAAKHNNNNNNNNNNNTNNNAAVPKQQVKVLLKRRCLQVMTGKARYEYTHGITNQDLLSERRVSITMRDSPLTIKK